MWSDNWEYEPLEGPPRDLVAVLPIPLGEPAVLHCLNEAEAAKIRRNMTNGAAYALGPCYCPKGADNG